MEAQVIRLPIQHVIRFIWNKEELLLTNHTSDPRHFEDLQGNCFQQIWISLDSLYPKRTHEKLKNLSRFAMVKPWRLSPILCFTAWLAVNHRCFFVSEPHRRLGSAIQRRASVLEAKDVRGTHDEHLEPWAVVGSVVVFFLVENLKIACRISLLC